VIPLGPRQSEEPVLLDRIAAGPESEREAETSLTVRDPEDAVRAPAVGTAARVIVPEVLPAVPELGVILADRAPLALRQIGPPALPVLLAPGVFREPRGFRSGRGRLRSAGAQEAARSST
jgi:hypothetical protein